jgi:hypothetical protein
VQNENAKSQEARAEGIGIASELGDSVTVEAGSRFLKVSGCFLIDYSVTCLVCYLGQEANVTIWRNIERISAGCFNSCDSLSSVTFAADCQVSILEESAFGNCSSLQSICTTIIN